MFDEQMETEATPDILATSSTNNDILSQEGMKTRSG